jgi:small-conductance mechanosensitive channel
MVQRAEDTISRGAASDAAFEELRRELVRWRNIFEEAQSINASRIRTIEAQIAALGPAPGEGETEPEAVAELRRDLNAMLDELMVPVRAAEVAFNRADALIIEIDQILRNRQAEILFDRVASPLLPSTWTRAWREIQSADLRLRNELLNASTGSAAQERLRERMPGAVGLLILGVALIFLGRRMVERLSSYVETRNNGAAGHLMAFAVSLGQVVLPILGLGAVLVAGQMSYATGFLSQTLLGATIQGAASVVLARWLALRVFPPGDVVPSIGGVAAADRASGRRMATLLGALYALHVILDKFSAAAGFSGETISVMMTPLIFATALVLWRMGTLFLRASRETDKVADGDAGASRSESNFLSGIFWVLGQALHFVAFAGPIAAVIGFGNLASAVIFPSIASLGVLAVIATLHRLFSDLYALLSGRSRDEAREALVPVLATLLVGVASIPFFALVWGARWTDITDGWARLSEGFVVGDTRIGLGALVTMIIVFLIGYGLTRLLQATLRSAVLPRTRLDAGGQNALTVGVGYVGITIASLAAITAAGIDLTAFALVASALSVGIGFGLRTVVENFVAGIIMLIERPISEGDWIEVGPQMGIVKNISVRSTTVEAFDRSQVIIPNGDLIAGVVTNYTRGNTVGRLVVPVGVSYASDSRHVERVLLDICESHPLVAMDPPPRVMFRGFGDNALQMECFCILRDVNFRLQVHSDINHMIHERFREEGIGIPFPQRDFWLRNPEDLSAGRPAPDAAAAIETGKTAGEGKPA